MHTILENARLFIEGEELKEAWGNALISPEDTKWVVNLLLERFPKLLYSKQKALLTYDYVVDDLVDDEDEANNKLLVDKAYTEGLIKLIIARADKQMIAVLTNLCYGRKLVNPPKLAKTKDEADVAWWLVHLDEGDTEAPYVLYKIADKLKSYEKIKAFITKNFAKEVDGNARAMGILQSALGNFASSYSYDKIYGDLGLMDIGRLPKQNE